MNERTSPVIKYLEMKGGVMKNEIASFPNRCTDGNSAIVVVYQVVVAHSAVYYIHAAALSIK